MNEDSDLLIYGKLVALTLIVLGIGVSFYHVVEKFSWIDSLYFCVITLTTVGYGDFSPQTDLGKLFTVVYVLVGIGIITTFITTMAKRQRQRIEKRNHVPIESKDSPLE